MSAETIKKYINYYTERSNEFLQGDLQIISEVELLKEFEKKLLCDLGVIYESPYHILLKDLVCSNGKTFPYERLLKKNSGNSVVMLPVYNDKFILLKQFRHALRDYQIGFPRGFGEKDISIEDNVKKELSEELGCNTINCEFLGKVVADSGICGEKVSIFLCEIDQPKVITDHEGIKDIIALDWKELLGYIDQEHIDDGFTLSAINLYMIKKQLYLTK